MDINPARTTTTQMGQLADSTIPFDGAPDISMARATPSLCDACLYVPGSWRSQVVSNGLVVQRLHDLPFAGPLECRLRRAA